MQVSKRILKVWAAVCFFGNFVLVAKEIKLNRSHVRVIYPVNSFTSKRIKNISIYPRVVAQCAKIVSKINSQFIHFNSLFLYCKITFQILVHSHPITLRLLFPSKSKVLLY